MGTKLNHQGEAVVQKTRFANIEIRSTGFLGTELRAGSIQPVGFSASYELFLIAEAQRRGCSFEDLADGFGKGQGTHGDWSGIRDSSGQAVNAMLERALNHLFG